MNITFNILPHRLLCLAALMLLVVGCSEDINYPSGNLSAYEVREVELPVAFDIESMISAEPPTRAADDGDVDTELRIHDFWLIQFGPDGKRVGNPYYHRLTGGDYIPMVIPAKDGVEFRCVIIANTNKPDLFNAVNTQTFDDIEKLPELNIKGGFFFSAESAYCVIEDGKQYPLMSGQAYVNSRSTGLESVLKCYFAQVLLRFRFEGEKFSKPADFEILKSIKIVNVPKKYRYTGELYHPFDPKSPESGNPKDYTSFEILVSQDKRYQQILDQLKNNHGFDYLVYLPRRNFDYQLIGGGVQYAETSIQFEVKNKNSVANNQDSIIYQFVDIIRSKTATSFNENKTIVPGTKYDLTIEIRDLYASNIGNGEFSNVGSETSREPYGNGYILSHANSFILNPDSLLDRHIKIPFSRIDQFYFQSVMDELWREEYLTDLDRFARLKDQVFPDLPFPIVDNTKWHAEILWQDTPERLIYFVDKEGNADFTGTNEGKVEGTGSSYLTSYGSDDWGADNFNEGGFCFRLTGAKGNLVIGIRKDYEEGEDYDFSQGTFPYYDNTVGKDKQYLWCFHLWITDYVPSDEVEVMDRNLGAMSVDDPGLYYYSNRKDPVPSPDGNKAYNHLGNPVSCFHIGGLPPSDYMMMKGGETWLDDLMFRGIARMLLRRVEWAFYSLRHPLSFFSTDEGYWFNPEYTAYRNEEYIDEEEEWQTSIYHYLKSLRKEDDEGDLLSSKSLMLVQLENPMAETAIERKSMFDPCPDGWRLPEGASDIRGHKNARNMKGTYWTSTYNTEAHTYDGKTITIKPGYDGTPFKIKGKALNVNGGSVTESDKNLATFLPVRCVRYVPAPKPQDIATRQGAKFRAR